MKDFDKQLSANKPKPKNELHIGFTNRVISRIGEKQKMNILQKLHSSLRLDKLSKAAAVSMAGIVLLSGTVAAITLWPKPSVTQTTKQQLPSGNRIVGYDTQNCNYFGALDGSIPANTNEKVFYEVREGASITDEQLQNSLRAVCEENISNNAISRIVEQLPKDLPGMSSTQAYKIESISSDGLTAVLDSHYDKSAMNPVAIKVTLTKFDSNLKVYDQDNKASFADLKTGDTVKMIIQDTSGLSTETPENSSPFSHPEKLTVLAIVKIPPLTADPLLFYTSVAKYLVRVDPCNGSPSGFCQAYEFAQ